MKVKQVLGGLFMLSGWVFATSSVFAAPRQNSTAFSTHIFTHEDDSSKNKSFVRNCANFGNVYCNSNEGGGICGNVNTSDIQGCSNTGQVQGQEKIGGILGSGTASGSDSSNIRHCFNSGWVNASSQAGGMLGFLNGQTGVFQSYNIGNIVANSYAGGIVGRKYSQQATLFHCYYDRQMCLVSGINDQDQPQVAEGKYTLQCVGDSLATLFDTTHWNFRPGRYPQPRFGDSSLALKAATTPLFLQQNENIALVSHPFTLGACLGLHWTSGDSNSIRLSGNSGTVIRFDSNVTLSLGDNNHIYKNILFLKSQPMSSTPIVLYDTICEGEGYARNGFTLSDTMLAGIRDFVLHDSLKNQYGADSVRSLYLHIQPVYLLVFHSNDGNDIRDTLAFCGTQVVRLSDTLFSRSWHLFAGWSFDSLGRTVLQDGDSLRCTQDTHLFAIWQATGAHPDFPITIDNTAELIAFRNAVNDYKNGSFKGIANQSTGYQHTYFRLTADMDLDSLRQAGQQWIPIGQSKNSFRGRFNGDNHRISHLYIDNAGSDYAGLFGYLDSGAQISRIYLSSNDTVIGRKFCGGIAGFAGNKVVISRCHNEAFVQGHGESTGGILGKANLNDTITGCANYGHIVGDTQSTGGICGNLTKSALIACLNTGFVQGNEKCGGLTGYANGSSSALSCLMMSYNSGQVSGRKSIGGLIGNAYSYTQITQSYHSGQVDGNSQLGSLIGLKSQKTSVVSQCCYDRQISPVGALNNSDDSSAVGVESALMLDFASDWDTSYWDLRQGLYPQLSNMDSTVANRMAVLGLLLDSADDCREIFHDFRLSGCGFASWRCDKNSVELSQCSAHIVANDSLVCLQACYQGKVYKEFNIGKIHFRKYDTLRLQLCASQWLDTLGHRFAASGDTVISQLLQNHQGGDSLVTAIITVLARYEQHFYDTICQGESYQNHGFYLASTTTLQAGLRQFADSLTTVEGCDSIRILNLLIYPAYWVNLLSNDSSNLTWRKRVCGSNHWVIDTLPFQKQHYNLYGWGISADDGGRLFFGDTLWLRSDTTLFASWMPDGLSAAYALPIDNTRDFVDFRNAANDYNNGCYKGVCNQGKGFKNIYFSLNSDIDLNGECDSLRPWEPIGKSSSSFFKGRFEGNGHTVDNLYINYETASYKGIFGCVDSAEISNLSLGVHSQIVANKYVGGIVGYARNRSFIHGCANHAPIEGKGECVGGICGYLQQSTMQECLNTARIQGNEKVGGIVGSAGASGNNGTSVSYCFNSSSIQGKNCIGGIIGFLNGYSRLQRTYNCGQLHGESYAGSIVGRKYSSSSLVEHCCYDKQILPMGGVNGKDLPDETTGFFTGQMTGKGLENQLGSQHWTFDEDKYPQLQCYDHSPAAQIAIVPVFLTIPECSDHVRKDFTLGSWRDLVWRSSSENLRLEGSQAHIVSADSMVRLQAVWQDHVFKELLLSRIGSANGLTRSLAVADFRVFPNPTSDKCFIALDETSGKRIRIVRLFDNNGKLIFREETDCNLYELRMEHYAKGTYLLHVADNANGCGMATVTLR